MLQSIQVKLVLPVMLGAVVVLGLSAVCMAYNSSVSIAVLLIGGGTAILAAITAMSSRAVLAPLQALRATYERLSPEDMRYRATMPGANTLSLLVTAYNHAFSQLTQQLEATRTERDNLSIALQRLRTEVAEVARGNLAVEVATTTPATEAIATAFNTMIRQLRTVVGHMQEAVSQVSSSAHEIQTTADHLAHGRTVQATQIVESSAALDEMAVSIQDVSQHASRSATVAEQALANAKQGARAVQNTIQGMQRIRTQVQETAARIKQLGERSQEINEIVQLIGDIADRTSVLALNASIEAALAGEAGQGFAIVAQEVERLAQRATAATRQIASLVTTIQGETGAAVTAMEDSTHEVVQGSRLADQAGQTLGEIESVSARLAELIQSISLATKQQERGSENLSRAMGEISEVTQQMAAGTTQAAVSVNNLANLADELRSAVSAFRLQMPANRHRLSA